MQNYSDIWNKYLASESSKTDNSVWNEVRKQIVLKDVKDGVAYFSCPNQGAKTIVNTKHAELCTIVTSISSMSVFRIQCDIEKETPQTHTKSTKKKEPGAQLFSFEPNLDDLTIQSGLSPRHNFENFAVSPCNNVAFAAAQVVAGQPGRVYNPLFIWGGVGVGKTHLAQSIGRRVLQINSSKKIFFCAGDKFTNEIIEAIRNRSTEKFRQKYRKLDLLIVDDIQFISGKNTVQEEFFHTFNEIVSRGGQVILISDRPPTQIQDIEDRLRSRFAGGLTVDISPPDFELRTAIVLIKAKERNMDIDIEAAKVIAQNATDNRSIEGMLLSTYAYAFAANPNSPPLISVNEVSRYINKDSGQGNDSGVQRLPTADSVIDIVCSYYQLKPIHIKQPNRTEKIARARHVLMYVLREKLMLNYETIARTLKRKDHTTVIHGVNKIKQEIIHNQFLKNDIEIICKNLNIAEGR
ncbi:MAG: chromosomal replication initiator protein DnaA [Patescibacteria group bacterium]